MSNPVFFEQRSVHVGICASTANGQLSAMIALPGEGEDAITGPTVIISDPVELRRLAAEIIRLAERLEADREET